MSEEVSLVEESVITENKTFLCEFCARNYKTKRTLRAHLLTHGAQKPFLCQFCSKGFNKKINLVEHIKKTHLHTSTDDAESELVVCGYCCDVFSDSATLQAHITDAHRVPTLTVCKYCNKSYKPTYIKLHMLLHTNEKPYVCEVCGKAFHTKAMCRLHSWIHAEKKPFSCTLCDKTFDTRRYLRIHTNYHMNVKPYKCDICDMRFTEKANLRKHHRTHSTDKPFKCKFCQKDFKHKVNYLQHLNMHTREKLFSCDKCKMTFTYKKRLKYHLERHDNCEPLFCKQCNKKFGNRSSLLRHQKIHIISIAVNEIESDIGDSVINLPDIDDSIINLPVPVIDGNIVSDYGTGTCSSEGLVVKNLDVESTSKNVKSEPSVIDDGLEHMEQIYFKEILVIRSAQTNEYILIENE